MNRSLQVALLLLASLGTSASQAGFKPQPFVANPNAPIKTIGVLQVPESRYLLGEGTTRPSAGMFLNPALGAIIDHATKEKHPEYEAAGFSFAPVAQRQVINHLKAAGYKVVVVPVARDKPNQLLKSYNALPTTGVDAYLDIAPTGVGFQGSYAPFAKKVGPHVALFVRLVSAHTKEVLYQDYIHYGWGIAPAIAGTELEAPEAHVFKKTKVLKNDLMSADKQQSIAQLTHGIDVVMQTIVAAFSAYSVRGLPQQAGATPRTDAPIEVSKAAQAAMPSPGAAMPRGIASTVYKIAIFPFAGGFGTDHQWYKELETAEHLQALIQQNSSLRLVYSHYDKTLDDPPIRHPNSLWSGQKPNIQTVLAMGRQRNLDGIVMVWGDHPGGWGSGGIVASLRIHMFDVKQQKVFRGKGTVGEKNVRQMGNNVLSQFLQARTQAVAAAPPAAGTATPTAEATPPPTTSAKAAPTQRGEVRSNQTASAASPFEGITLRPGGSVEAINAAAEAYCGSLNKKSKLIAAPPNNPDYVFQCYQPTKAVPTPTPSPKQAVARAAPGVQKGAVPLAYKIAIFPFESDSHCVGRSRPSDERFAAELRTFIKSNDALALVYSYYDPNLNDPPIEKPGRLWKGSKPNVAQVYALGQSQGVDAVVMYWRPVAVGVGQGSCSSFDVWYPIEVYVFDVKQRKVYRLKGHERNLSAMTKQALSRFVTGRR